MSYVEESFSISKMKNKKNPESDSSWDQPNSNGQEEEVDDEELNSINNQLDLLNNALDELEQKNDNLHAQLVQLLESNRQARKLFQQMQDQNDASEKKEKPN